MSATTTAVILAAGSGGRLSGVSGALPKCLLPIGNQTLLGRQLDALRRCGVERIVVVAGYRADEVHRAAGPEVRIVQNARFGTTNSLYSLWLARDFLTSACVVLNSDVLFHQQILDDLMTARYEDAVMVAASNGASYSSEEMKVQIRGGCIVSMDKGLSAEEADGENVGVAKFGAGGARTLAEEARQLVESGGSGYWAPAAFTRVARRRPVHAVDTRGFPWIEIDFAEDYERACSEVLPEIAASERVHAHV